MRKASVARKTRETEITLELNLDGKGIAETCLEAIQHEKETGRSSV